MCLLIALFINDLSGYSYYRDGLGKMREKCEWNKICLNAETEPEICFKYSECNNYLNISSCKDTQTAGEVYLSLTIIALIASFIGTIACFNNIACNKLSKYVSIIYSFCCILCVFAACIWIWEGNRGQAQCYNIRNEYSYLGASITLIWIAMIGFLFAAMLTLNKKPPNQSAINQQQQREPLVSSEPNVTINYSDNIGGGNDDDL